MEVNHNSISVLETRFLLIKVFLHFLIDVHHASVTHSCFICIYANQVGVLKLRTYHVISHIFPVSRSVYVYICFSFVS